MSKYTEADYRRIYADLEKQEQESIKAYNAWLMQMQMAINNYNATLIDSGLDTQFPTIDVTTEEEIEALDIESIKRIYDTIMEFREKTRESVEIALGLRDSKSENVIQQADTIQEFDDDFFGDFDIESVGNPLED